MKYAMIVAAVLAAACSKTEKEQPKEQAPATTPPPAPVDAAPAAQEYVIGYSDAWVKVKLPPLPGWTLQNTESALHFQGPGMSLSMFSVGVTCHGSCDTVETAQKNIPAVATERFEFVKSKNHIPQLVPTWAQEPKETAPGTWYWRFDAVNVEEKQEEHAFSIDRILLPPKNPTSTKILTCNANVDEHDPGFAETFEAICRDLVFERIEPPPPPDAAP